MSQISFDQINLNEGNNGDFKVGFFSLKNDGDEAIVRIMHDDISSFDLVTTHPVTIDGKYRRVNCIRDPREPIDNCPLCKNGTKIQQRMYVHLIQYVKDDNGNIIPQAKTWERPASYAVTVKSLIEEYGPLSDCIFKIKRNGAAGSTNTTYSVMYGNPNIYRNEFYPKDTEVFADYHALGNTVMNKTFEELAEFIATGSFPKKQPVSNLPSNNSTAQAPFNNTSVSAAPNYANTGDLPFTMGNESGAVQRPVRYY